MPSRPATACIPAARAGSRTATVAARAPSWGTAARAARAGAPAPRITTGPAALTPASVSAAAMPATSVLKPCREPPVKTIVLAPATCVTTGSTVSSSGSTASFSGMVSDRPAQSGPQLRTRPGKRPSSHSIASYSQPVRPSAAYAARCSTGDSEWPTGEPRTAALNGSASACSGGPALGLVLGEHRRAVGELGETGLRVHRHEVRPVPWGRMQRCLDRRLARAVNGPRRQAQVNKGVVRRVHVQLRSSKQEAEPMQRIEHGAVQSQVHFRVQPVVDNPGDLPVVAGTSALRLEQAGHDDDLTRGELLLRGRRREIDARRLLVETLDQGLQDAERGGAGLDGIGRRVQVALEAAAGVSGQPERGGVLRRA